MKTNKYTVLPVYHLTFIPFTFGLFFAGYGVVLTTVAFGIIYFTGMEFAGDWLYTAKVFLWANFIFSGLGWVMDKLKP